MAKITHQKKNYFHLAHPLLLLGWMLCVIGAPLLAEAVEAGETSSIYKLVISAIILVAGLSAIGAGIIIIERE